jgi:hypothetical protein
MPFNLIMGCLRRLALTTAARLSPRTEWCEHLLRPFRWRWNGWYGEIGEAFCDLPVILRP